MANVAAMPTSQVAFGPQDLRKFLEFLDLAEAFVPEVRKDHLRRVSEHLHHVSSNWDAATDRSGSTEPDATITDLIDLMSTPTASWTTDKVVQVFSSFYTHVRQMITRHSNFAFAVINKPSLLDENFPANSLTELRASKTSLGLLARPIGT